MKMCCVPGRRVPATLVILCLFLAVPLAAPADAGAGGEGDAEARANSLSKLERLQSDMSEFVLGTADRVDGFFASDRHDTYEENRTRLRLIVDTDYVENHGVDFSPALRLRLVLPRFQNRLSLIFNDEGDEGLSEIREDPDQEANVALRWLGKQTRMLNLSLDVGMRWKDDTLAAYGRANTQVKYPMGRRWAGRTTGQLYWYTDTGWRLDLRQYFERTLSQRLFLRSRTRAQWFEEEGSTIFPEQAFSLYHRLGERQAVAYEAIAKVIPADGSLFEDEEIVAPDDLYTRYEVRARYRVNLWKPWLFFELWPGILMPEEREYEVNWNVRFRVEIYFGYTPGQTRLGED